MRTITGTAKYKDGTPAIGVNVYLAQANRQRVGNIGATTDINGKWSMSFDPKPGYWIQASSNLSGAFWNQILRDSQNEYEIDFSQARGTALLNEVVVIADRPKPKPEPEPKPEPKPEPSWWSKNKLWVIIGGSLLFITMTTSIIVIGKKNSKKSKKR